MKLRDFLVEQLAEMVIGDNGAFPYRSSWYITRFFSRCGLPFVHDGTTRKWWTLQRLNELNGEACALPDLPSEQLINVILEMMDEDDFDRAQKSRADALVELNKVLKKQSLVAYFDADGRCQIRNDGTGTQTANLRQPRPLSAEELAARERVLGFLDSASEDEFTEKLLVPLFQRLGFYRVSPSGHKEKTLEYGKDLWMKFLLPTGHWLYFGAQIKREKLDASGASSDSNTAAVLNQILMALDHPVFDPDTGRKVLIDHIFVISAGDITRAARNWLAEKLDQSQRRQIIFMDRDEFLNHSARILRDLNLDDNHHVDETNDLF